MKNSDDTKSVSAANYRCITAVFACILTTITVAVLSLQYTVAQDKPADSSIVKFRGSAIVSADFYHGSSSDSTFRPRLQPFSVRSIVRAEITLPSDIALPFEFYGSTQNITFQQPFNQLGINPRIGSWLTLHAGFFSVMQSDFTFGDLRLCGGGIEIAPGDFWLSAAYGIGAFMREPIPSANYPGEYSRIFALASVGYGKSISDNIRLNFSFAKDDTAAMLSLADSLRPPPRDNLAASMSFALNPVSWLSLGGETAATVYTDDARLPAINYEMNLPKFLIEPRISTRIDGAAKFSAMMKPSKNWNVKVDAKWIGPGFVTLGWQALQNDVLDVTLAPSARLVDGTLNFRVSGGVRFNNLRNNRLAAIRRIIASAYIGWQITPTLGLDVQYGNYGMRSAHLNDTLRIQNIFRNLNVSPRFAFDWLGGVNSVSANYSLQDVDDKNVFSHDFTRSVAHTISAVHILSLPSGLNFTTTTLYNSFAAAGIVTSVTSLTETVGQSYFDDALSLAVTAGINTVSAVASDKQFTAGINASYFMQKSGTVSINISTNSFTSAQQLAQTPSFRELTAGATWRVTF
ncbi:MAG: hypothetical protein LC116_08075 [Bacteroidetes bacterium]|nr:hypothetical protein [Bacteroidota bacterium]